MNILYIEGSCWMRDENYNLKPFIKNKYIEMIFNQFGDKLIYPEVYWYEGDYLFPYLEDIVEKNNIDLIIGYSAGGYTGFHLCNKYKINGIHFNPAIAPTSEAPTLQLLPDDYKKLPIYQKQVILIGDKDRKSLGGVDGHLVINYLKNKNFGGEIMIVPGLEHEVFLNIFNMTFDHFRNSNFFN